MSGDDIVCGGRRGDGSLLSSCYSLQGATWQEEPGMITARSGAGASSGPGGILVTGGFGSEGYLATSEVFRDGTWIEGPSLPAGIEGHCQVQRGEDIYIVGRKLIYINKMCSVLLPHRFNGCCINCPRGDYPRTQLSK